MRIILLVVMVLVVVYFMHRGFVPLVRGGRRRSVPPHSHNGAPAVTAAPKPQKPPKWEYVGSIIEKEEARCTGFFHDYANDRDGEFPLPYLGMFGSEDELTTIARALCDKWNADGTGPSDAS